MKKTLIAAGSPASRAASKPVAATLALCLSLALVGCGSTGSSSSNSNPNDSSNMTYDQALRELRRPPTEAKSHPDGRKTAVWTTEVKGGTRRLTLNFGPDGRLESHNQTTVPRRR